MTLLDRFRTASPDKHPDASVRIAHVETLPLEDRHAIAAIARQDEDPRVRRAAVAKLLDAGALGGILRDESDEAVRQRAVDMLRDLALEAFEGVGESEALDAVDALSDAKVLGTIAKSAARDIIALRALSRISDPHVWGSIARHGGVEAARRSALDLLRDRQDQAELLAVAMNGEFKDTAAGAVDLVSSDRANLDQIAQRARSKAAVKRARALIREAEGAVVANDADASADIDLEPSEVHAAPPPAAASDGLEAPLVANSAEPASAVVSEASQAETDAARLAEKARLEQIERERLEADRQELERQARDTERRAARLVELADQAERAIDDPDPSTARRRFNIIGREWTDVSSRLTVDPALAARVAQVEARLIEREQHIREAEARAKQEALTHLQHLLGRVDALLAKPDLSLKAAERAARDLRTALSAIPPLPTKQDAEEAGRRLKAAHAALTPKLQELRDADDWQRWANAGIQEELCAKMEALKDVEDPETIARIVRELQEQWRKAADVPRAQADALWRRFKTAHDVVWSRCEAHFAAEAQARAENLAQRVALCEKAEALAESTDWIRTADEIKKLQADWKTIGPVPRGREKAIWERFRTACDRFFTRRHADLAERKTQWTENLSKKTALCERVEALAQSTDWDVTAAEIKRLQAEWKAIGPVKKSRSEPIWQRFRAACDLFFARYGQRHEIVKAERVAARETICAELEALSPAPAHRPEETPASSGDSSTGEAVAGAETAAPASGDVAQAPDDLLGKVRTLRSRWQQEIAARGVDPDRARALDARFAAANAAVLARWPAAFAGTDLDPDANRKRMESLVIRAEEIARSIGESTPEPADAALSPATRLAAMLKEALAANTIGGKVQDNSRLNAAVEDLRQVQANWARLGPVAEPTRRPLADRFQRASRAVLDRAAKSGELNRSGELGRPGGESRGSGAGRPGGGSRPAGGRRDGSGRPSGTGQPGSLNRPGGPARRS